MNETWKGRGSEGGGGGGGPELPGVGGVRSNDYSRCYLVACPELLYSGHVTDGDRPQPTNRNRYPYSSEILQQLIKLINPEN